MRYLIAAFILIVGGSAMAEVFWRIVNTSANEKGEVTFVTEVYDEVYSGTAAEFFVALDALTDPATTPNPTMSQRDTAPASYTATAIRAHAASVAKAYSDGQATKVAAAAKAAEIVSNGGTTP